MYKIVDTKKKVDVFDAGTFAKREDAKSKRDELNGGPSHPNVRARFVIARTADHWRGETDGFDHSAKDKWL